MTCLLYCTALFLLQNSAEELPTPSLEFAAEGFEQQRFSLERTFQARVKPAAAGGAPLRILIDDKRFPNVRLSIYAEEAGVFDLNQFLVSEIGEQSPLDGPLIVRVHPILPRNHDGSLFDVQGLRDIQTMAEAFWKFLPLAIGAVIWLLGLVVLIRMRPRRAAASTSIPAAPLSFDVLGLVDQAIDGTLSRVGLQELDIQIRIYFMRISNLANVPISEYDAKISQASDVAKLVLDSLTGAPGSLSVPSALSQFKTYIGADSPQRRALQSIQTTPVADAGNPGAPREVIG